jgi:DnaJ-class molecular chaperone
MSTMWLVQRVLVILFMNSLSLLLLPRTVYAFIPPDCTRPASTSWRHTTTTTKTAIRSTVDAKDFDNHKSHYLLQEYCIASGEVINPYKILKVSRKATRDEIRASYVKQSRRYHPDGFRNKRNAILPGSCNNLEDVRDQWERIKLSYEILSNPKTRIRYDRHDALSDPNAAIQRAVISAAFDGISNVGKGVTSIGSFAAQFIKKQ